MHICEWRGLGILMTDGCSSIAGIQNELWNGSTPTNALKMHDVLNK